jgi:hypothetical protein
MGIQRRPPQHHEQAVVKYDPRARLLPIYAAVILESRTASLAMQCDRTYPDWITRN